MIRLRELVLDVASETSDAVELEETLKWGEPAYLTEATRTGTTIRLGAPKSLPGSCAILFNCQTTLIDSFRAHFPDTFSYQGNRAILLDPGAPLPAEPLAICLGMALTYHRNKKQTGTVK